MLGLGLVALMTFGVVDLEVEVDRIFAETLKASPAPSFSVAIVKDGKLVLAKAYGHARLEPKVQATSAMHYAIGSISKQFTATAVLMLVDEKKLSLDDTVARFFPDLPRAGDVRVRDLLAHTAGLQDYWPQDYVPPSMMKDVDAEGVLSRWARRPLDFEPGTKWQYSNTGYYVAGLIVEKVSGEPLFAFLKKRVFEPLGMEVLDFDAARLGEGDPTGYTHYGLGPPRVAPKEGRGWMFAAGGLAMRAEDLARWNMAWSERKLLSAASYAELETEVRLKNGVGTQYGLGVVVGSEADRRKLSHSGEVSGFTAFNLNFPDEKASVTVLTNDDLMGYGFAVSSAQRIVPLLFQAKDANAEARAKKVFEQLQRGQVDSNQLSENATAYFSPAALKDFAASLKPLGAPTKLQQRSQSQRGGLTTRIFSVTCKTKKVTVIERDQADGRIEQFIVNEDG